jgi:ABC-type Zn uptake system ZnuABC Zn-binding protein ZnuA
LLDSNENNIEKIIEEWEEWNQAFGTKEEAEELVDLIHSLCNYFENRFGYQRLKKEDLKNIEDIKIRYSHLLK